MAKQETNIEDRTCGICDRRGAKNRRIVQCMDCEQWQHTTCMGMTTLDYRKIQNKDKDWYCNECTALHNVYTSSVKWATSTGL